MSGIEKASGISGQVTLALLWAVGAIGLTAFIPTWASGLEEKYVEYQGEQPILVILLGVPVLLFELVVIEVAYLLWLVTNSRMFTDKAFKWVRLLSLTSFAIAASLVALGSWLTAKNTFPPAVLFVLTAMVLFACAVGFITRSLQGLLSKATAATLDLEGVI